MNILYYLLTFLMFVDCVLLVFLVLLQLPKKEAGMGGMAFGGAATDALFGAGSGNVLTKITKYVAGIFFGLALLMAVMAGHKAESSASLLTKSVTTAGGAPLAPAAPAQTAPAPASNQLLQLPSAIAAPAPAATSNGGTVAPSPASPPPASTVNTNK